MIGLYCNRLRFPACYLCAVAAHLLIAHIVCVRQGSIERVDHMPASALFRRPLLLRTVQACLLNGRRHTSTARPIAAGYRGCSSHTATKTSLRDHACRASQSAANVLTDPATSPVTSKTQAPAAARRCVSCAAWYRRPSCIFVVL